jgi:hypothetical protein
MHVRVLRLHNDPAKADEALKLWEEHTLPLIKSQPGFAGATLLGDKTSGDSISATYWDGEQQMKDARDKVRPTGLKNLEATGGRIVEEDECAVEVMERFQPAKAGTFIRITTVMSDPAKREQGVAEFKQKVVPSVKKQPGARSSFLFVNHSSGKTFGGSGWDSRQDLDKSEAAVVDARRDIIEDTGGKGAKTESFEVLYTEILATAGSSR